MTSSPTKRLFFGVEIFAPWPEKLPKGRIIQETSRHLTLAFLGDIPWEPMERLLPSFPKFTSSLGVCGLFDKPLFLPERNPKVIAWHFHSFNDRLNIIQKEISFWLQNAGYAIDQRPFLPHATIARSPFSIGEWKKSFEILPMITGAIHLYESLGSLNYIPIWSYPLLPPFEQIEHTADIAYIVRGSDMLELEFNALSAIAFIEGSLRKNLSPNLKPKNSLDEIIISLNEMISLADLSEGISLKAVSFHGDLIKKEQFFEWEMIIDV